MNAAAYDFALDFLKQGHPVPAVVKAVVDGGLAPDEAQTLVTSAFSELNKPAPVAVAVEEPSSVPALPHRREDFRTIALRSAARGESRVLPIKVGGKNPSIKWKGEPIDVAALDEWTWLHEQWIDELAAQYPMANVAVIAKPDEHLFLDEDESERFRKGYEAFSGERFPRTFTTSARADRVQSHWKQTDATRKMGNIGQDQIADGILSVRQHNLYVLAEGSQHKNGVDYYKVVDASPIIPMPDKLVEYLLLLKAQRVEQKKEARETHELARVAPLASSANTSETIPVIGDDVAEGGRNNALSRFAYHRWVLELCTEGELREEVHAMNDAFSIPLPQAEVDYLIDAKLQLRQIGSGVRIDGKLIPARRVVTADTAETEADDDADFQSFQEKINKLAAEGKTPDEIAAALGIIQTVQAEAPNEISDEVLDREFPGYDGQEVPDIPLLIEGFLPKGVTFFGSLAGVGKTWVGLSIAKALTTGKPFVGVFPVKEKVGILYLIPEASDATFKYRMRLMGIPKDKTLFRYRTISQGATLSLGDQLTLAAVKKLLSHNRQVLVIVDTAIRFMTGGDENASSQNNLSPESEQLRALGADVLFMHHAKKDSKKFDMSLEAMLRGTGDFGAMADCVYGLRRDEGLFRRGFGPEQVEVECVKPRDMKEPPLPFRLEFKRKADGSDDRTVSVIEETGDLRYIGPQDLQNALASRLGAVLATSPTISLNDLVEDLNSRKDTVKDLATSLGWKQVPTIERGPDGQPLKTQRGTVKKRFHWTRVTMGGAENSVPGSVTNTVTDEAAGDEELESNSVSF